MIRCEVCGKRIHPKPSTIYMVSEEQTILGKLTDSIKVFDAVDCWNCGCQVVLHVRMPRFGRDNDDQ